MLNTFLKVLTEVCENTLALCNCKGYLSFLCPRSYEDVNESKYVLK